MTFKYNNVYINEVATITGPYENKGPLAKYFDKSYSDFYFKAKTFEQAESKILEESVDLLLNKLGKTRYDIDIQLSGEYFRKFRNRGGAEGDHFLSLKQYRFANAGLSDIIFQ